ncbi:Ni,Fe-hydrogenase I large subunit [Methylobacter sp. YRD-M1]|uniref:Ni,Fe-hydrogenase I large subunit n=1 Tax=Methylobacter sp. YRD-M1 TaxID=2911520 RepID=UPI00227ACB13|nr:Ni,Fe-hydrogenase I large subunit [Methylobacter sp. YRD-M1]WAK04010.1 Ni,Fe-hydrogenase I large subunit [Methylobacter sp. YRD-M1]
MTPAGTVHIELWHRAGQASGARIASSRPDIASQVLPGKTPEQVLDIVPLLFTLCGNAQSYAALLACRAALGMAAEPEPDAARDLLVQLETLREHTWRILLDWPGLIGLAPNKKALAALLKFDAFFKRHLFRHGQAYKLDSRLDIDAVQLTRMTAELEALIDAAIFNGRLADFRTLTCETQLRDWLRQNDALPANLLSDLYSRNWTAIGQNDVDCLPGLEAEALSRQMQQEDLTAFCRAPRWQGRCFETTPLARQQSHPLIAGLQHYYGNGLMVRFLARLLEVAAIPLRLSRLTERKPDPAIVSSTGGIGLAQLQAARGLLIHRLELRHGRVYDYRIVAPTEWNFHPEGAVAQGLKQLKAEGPDDLRRQAELLINAVDPCVLYNLKLADSDNEAEAHA